jgi:hypothetical protein
MARKNRWHPVVLPDDYIRKMKQDLSEVEAQVESKTRCEPDPDFSPPPDNADEQRTAPCGDGLPLTGGFATLQPEDADYAVEVCRRADSRVGCRVQLRLEPEHGRAPSNSRGHSA